MNKKEMAQKFESLKNDKDFAEQMAMVETVQDVQEIFAKNGIELSVEDIERSMAFAQAKEANGELSEEMLDDVSGGFVFALVGAWTLFNVAIFGGAYKLSRSGR